MQVSCKLAGVLGQLIGYLPNWASTGKASCVAPYIQLIGEGHWGEWCGGCAGKMHVDIDRARMG